MAYNLGRLRFDNIRRFGRLYEEVERVFVGSRNLENLELRQV
jgi:hypothetical protein